MFLAFCNLFALGTNSASADADFAKTNVDFAASDTDFAAGDAKDGQSTSTFDTGTQAVTAMFKIVRSAEDPDNEDLTAAGANIVVVMNSAANHYINGRDA